MTSRRNNPIQPKLDVRIELPGMITFTLAIRSASNGQPKGHAVQCGPNCGNRQRPRALSVTNRGIVYSNVASVRDPMAAWAAERAWRLPTKTVSTERRIDGIAPIGDRRKQYLQLITLRIGR